MSPAKMTKRERVIAALNHQETDRTPVYDILLNDGVIELLTGRFPPIGEEGLKLRLQATAAILDMTRMASVPPVAPGRHTDEDGFVYYQEDRWIAGGILQRPFTDEAGAREWLIRDLNRLKQPFDERAWAERFRKEQERIRSYLGDDTVVIQEYGTGLDRIRYLLGLEFFSYLSVDDPGLISEYLHYATEREIRKIHAVEDASISPCALPYGDIAYKNGLLHSPEWLRREFFPLIRRLTDALHEHGVKCLFHSDGDITPVIPDLIEAGVDGLNPIEVVAGMDLAHVKRLYGDRLFLVGGIDISQLMARSSPEEVRAVCLEAIRVASPGYFIGSTTELDNGSKPENIIAMIEAAWGEPVPLRGDHDQP
ncbi:MAG: hypothetical protein J7M34_09780 [Anaerolineae bacterium]|nr:hypothetical protein [Anaerolineae bacterium]